MKAVCVDKGHPQDHNLTVGKTYDVFPADDFELTDLNYNIINIHCYTIMADDNGKGGYRCEQSLFIHSFERTKKNETKKYL